MKRFLSLIALGALSLAAVDATAQTRVIGAHRLVIDNNLGTGSATLQYNGVGHVFVTFPPFPSTTVPLGTLTGQTLAWDQTNADWDIMSNWLNDGVMLAATSPLTMNNIAGGNITTFNEDGITRSVNGNFAINTGAANNSNILSTNGQLQVVGAGRAATPSNGVTMGFDNVQNIGIELVSTGAGPRQAYIDFTRNGATDFDARIINTSDNELMIDGANLNLGGNGILNVSTLNTSGVVTHTNLSANMPVKTNDSDQLVSAAINLASTDVTGVLPVANGGTGGGSFAGSRVIVSNPAGTALQANAAGTADQLLHGDLTWGAVNLATAQVTGILPEANVDALIARDAEVTTAINTAVNGTAGRLAVFTGTNAVGNGNLSGDVTTAGGTVTTISNDAVTSAKILDDQITNADINSAAGIVDTKLATIATAGKVANSATTATSAAIINTIVMRDADGDFMADDIVADNFSGNFFMGGTFTGDGANLTNLNAANIATGTLGVARGGTGLSAVNQGDLLVGGAANTLTTLAAGATAGHVLTTNGAGVAPSWQSPSGNGAVSTGAISGSGQIPASTLANRLVTVQHDGANSTYTMTLANGTIPGQMVILKAAGVDSNSDFIFADAGNLVMNNVWTPGNNGNDDTLTLVWDGANWVEVSRSVN